MYIKSKLYEILKFAKDFGFGVITIVSALMLGFGCDDKLIMLITLCISSLCQIIVLFINTCSKNHWKAVAEDGSETEIEPVEENEEVK